MTTAGRQPPVLEPERRPVWMDGLLRLVLGASAHNDSVLTTPLDGGVASDILRVDAGSTTFCVKRARPKLKVAADWQVPVERNRFEAAWIREAAAVVPEAVPRVLAEDLAAGAFAMEWLPPARFPVWKDQLRDGLIDGATAARVGEVLGRVHAATADRHEVAERFATDALFHAIRLDPYLVATARAHPDLAERLAAVVDTTATTRRVLVHGDFSPKNLLIGPAGPVVIDAECAWYGDPAFDLAFVLNHLLLKGAWRPRWRRDYLALFSSLADAYGAHVTWEAWDALDARTAALLPGLMLARIDGKSPVEYLSDEREKAAVRSFARTLIVSPVRSLSDIAARWQRAA